MIKGNELSSHKKAWRKLRRILLSERGRSEKAINILYGSSYMAFRERQTLEVAGRSRPPAVMGKGGTGVSAEHRRFLGHGDYSG